ncbi:hypothetical protein BLAT2472_40334 [Burkholderia latens]
MPLQMKLERAFECPASRRRAMLRAGRSPRMNRRQRGRPKARCNPSHDPAKRPSRAASTPIAGCGRSAFHTRRAPPSAFESRAAARLSERRFFCVADHAPFGSTRLPRGLHATTRAAYLYSYRCQDFAVARCAAGPHGRAGPAATAARKRGEPRT